MDESAGRGRTQYNKKAGIEMFDLTSARILLTGAHGFLGGYVYEQLLAHGASKSLIRTPSIEELDLRITENCIKAVRDIDLVIHLAANVGGIGYNAAHPGELFYDNAKMGLELVEQSRLCGVRKFVQVGTVCAYPRTPPRIPFIEKDLWEGYPEESSAPYGIAKKMLMVQLQAYRAQYGFSGIYLLPTNLYGPRDNFDPTFSHVIPALVLKFIEGVRRQSPEVMVWGTGAASREFIFAEDAARGIVLAAMRYDKPEPINLGSSSEINIRELVEIIARRTGFSGRISWDSTKPDGQPRRKLDVSRAEREFGFRSQIELEEGLSRTVDWYVEHGGPYRSPSAIPPLQ
jgi:GDP-L-fucose synthase